MTKMIIILISLPLLFCCQYPCLKNNINPVFIGFSPSDIDTIVLKAYRPNDNFQHLEDTFLIHNKYATIYTTSDDSTVVYINDSDRDHWISAGFDWQIYIPAKNKTVFISNIISPETEGSKGCINPIESFIQDGQLIKPQPINTGKFYTSGYLLYIHN